MDSSLLARIHTVSVMIFLLIYLVKTILLFSSKTALFNFSKIVKVPEMIVSALFLITGVWLFVLVGGIKVFHIIKLVCVFLAIPLAIIGFKKLKKGLALLSLFLIVAAYGLAEMSKSKPFIPAKAIAADGNNSPFAEGAVVFHSNCAFCHGTDGKKMYRNATDLSLSMANADAVKIMIREGSKGKMPAYTGVLSEQEVDAVTAYVLGLRPVSPAAE